MRDVVTIEAMEPSERPGFIVVPDMVCCGLESLETSLSWRPRLAGIAPLYLAVQDGMRPDDVAPTMGAWAGLFVGGSTRWKLRTGAAWAALAHERGLRCHVGRVGSGKRVRWALEIGADSIDSCLPLWSAAKLEIFRAALVSPTRPMLGDLALCASISAAEAAP